ncbi:ATP-binding cassette domain-containing protein [Histidinibacterium aquaticum]|uniref:ATP-binding cassette domain-containing protein n=1 Tax=Histidinibacterium aquaticum TaxID=2613962 RepID=A0A5J5GJX1_9RHOB|nr:ATP-binding cassette domain-containing protein [Histidinibacterium aquaticum]KAA9007824.1 ATP-binding cassette domain-containing protein [Histidinibacterium aquaticum]
MIETLGLSLERDGAPVLRDVSLQLPGGGITALIGPNGAGKSSLLHALAGLLPPSAGEIRLEGTSLARIPARERALRLALLTQDQAVTTRLTVGDLVAFGRWPHHRGRPGAEDRRAVAEALAHFDLGGLADRPLESLSGGQRQRAHVAMAQAQSTPWMLLDEPLAALDPRYARDIMERLHALTRPGPDQRGVVIVLHDLGMAARFADHVVALKDGRLVRAGPRAEVMTAGVLSGLFDTGLAVERVRGRDVVVPV